MVTGTPHIIGIDYIINHIVQSSVVLSHQLICFYGLITIVLLCRGRCIRLHSETQMKPNSGLVTHRIRVTCKRNVSTSKKIGIVHQDLKCKCSHGESLLTMLFIAGLILISDFGKLTQLFIFCPFCFF